MSHRNPAIAPRPFVIPSLLVSLLAALTPEISHGQPSTTAPSRSAHLERAVTHARSPERTVTIDGRAAPPTVPAAPSDEVLLSDSRNYPDPVRFTYVANAARLPDVGFVLFDLASAELSTDARETLDAICRVANDGPVPFDLVVVGHASDEGEAGLPGTAARLRFEQYNYELSVERARAAADHLRDRCMPGDRVSFYGMGLQDHVNRLDSLDARQRRVEIKMLGHDPTWTAPAMPGASASE